MRLWPMTPMLQQNKKAPPETVILFLTSHGWHEVIWLSRCPESGVDSKPRYAGHDKKHSGERIKLFPPLLSEVLPFTLLPDWCCRGFSPA